MKEYPSRALLNRELSWLEHNDRVLREGGQKKVPLFERAALIGSHASNLDDFFQLRVSALLDINGKRRKKADASGLSVNETLKRMDRHMRQSRTRQMKIYRRWRKAAKKEGMPQLEIQALSKKKKAGLQVYFQEQVFSVLAPVLWEKGKIQFANLRLVMLVQLKRGKIGIVQLPPLLDRLIDGQHALGEAGFLLAEDLIAFFVQDLFPAVKIKDVAWFRVTRSTLQSEDEKLVNLADDREAVLIERGAGRIVRVELEDKHPWAFEFLRKELGVKKKRIMLVDGPLDLSVLKQFCNIAGEKGFYPELRPADKEWWNGNLFQAIQKKDRIHAIPYESEGPVTRFLQEAALDVDIISIWLTLQGGMGGSDVLKILRQAALHGKQVTVFKDPRVGGEEAEKRKGLRALEEAGCQVIEEHPGGMVHAEAILVTKKEDGRLRSYVYVSTGSDCEETDRLATGLGLFTADPILGRDLLQVFHYLTGACKVPKTQKLSAAPFEMRKVLMARIQEAIHAAKRGDPSWIFLKMKELSDPKLIHALYAASQAGVQVDCLIQGICCLRPGLAGLSENIQVKSIMGRFLEHQRIFYFVTREKETMLLSSADWMAEALDHQVEILCPIEDRVARETVKGWMLLQWQDRRCAYMLQHDGTYQHVNGGKGKLDSQACLLVNRWERSKP